MLQLNTASHVDFYLATGMRVCLKLKGEIAYFARKLELTDKIIHAFSLYPVYRFHQTDDSAVRNCVREREPSSFSRSVRSIRRRL